MTSGLCPAPETGASRRRRERLLALGVLLAVVAIDQITKWWAWRHTPSVMDPGATWFLGPTVSEWYASHGRGAALDVLGIQVLTCLTFALVRRPRPAPVLVSGMLIIAGWGSNLLDRLGLHVVTAPGTARGAVDFLRVGWLYTNVADACIVVGTALFLAAAGADLRQRRRRSSPAAVAATGLHGWPWSRAWVWVLGAAVTPVLVAGTASLFALATGLD
jgi:lipoprotein signal peptidase